MSITALYNRGIFKGAALKFPFFLLSFSFGNEREENSARRANTTRLRAITIKEHSARSPQLRHGCPLSRTCRTSATKSPLGLFKENPTRIFFQGDPQSDCNRREGSPSLRLWRKFTHSCAQRTHKEFRALRSASRGSSPTPRKPSRRLDPRFVPWCGSESYVNIT